MEKVPNYYSSLCTEMYEILHKDAPQDELRFYLSYAEKGMKILEPLCGSGRFLIPFLQKGFDICGIDMSSEMIAKLKEKAPAAKVIQKDITEYHSEEKYDYIFIPSGSVSLFTNMDICRTILKKVRCLLKESGKFVFAVDTVKCRCPDDSDYQISVSVKTKDSHTLVLKEKKFYDEKTHTQFSPSIYELYNKTELLKQEKMDFQTHLYQFGEIDAYLKQAGFQKIVVYASYDKIIAENDQTEMLLYECSV